ncbi:MAG: OmpA family protein, partial [Verrucomicrobia bacterium]|nr:OmpA family protein [Verrucomicrobiota bacterium]
TSVLSISLIACASGNDEEFMGFNFHDSAQDSLLADTNALLYNPQSVGIYSINHLPTEQYKILGNVSINRYNRFGIKRTTASINPIRYAKGDANITNQQTRVLNEVQQVLKIFPNARFEIVGHTCDLGIADQNIDLSRRRAQSLHDFLLSKGIKKDRLKHRGMGQSEPAVPNTNEANRRQNRRVEVEILD